MKWILGALLLFVAPSSSWGEEPAPLVEIPAEDPGRSVDRLSTSVDRLTALLERDAQSRLEEREARRVEVAIGIIGLRYRKIERLEAEIQRSIQEEQEMAKQIGLMKAELEQLGQHARGESDELRAAARSEIALWELRTKTGEEHVVRLGQRRTELANEVAIEKRRLATVEAVLEAWMEKQ